MTTARRLAASSGVAGAVVGFAAILVAAVLSPTFSLATGAVSDLGAPGAANPWLLNGGLVASGLVGLPFAWALHRAGRHALQSVGAVAYAVAVLSLVLVGLFPSGTDLHAPAAVAYFVLATFTLWVHGTGTVLAGDPRRGLGAIWLGIAHVLAWLVWAAGLRPGDGLAIPELVGSLLFFVWILRTTAEMDALPGDLLAG